MSQWLLFLVLCSWLTSLAAMPPAQLEKFVSAQVALAATGSPMRIEIHAGQLVSRLKLKACTDLTPFIPPGTRLWGRAYVGLRCNEKPGWSAFIPVEVNIFSTVLVAARLLTAGQTVESEDIVMEEREITKLGPHPVMSLEQVRERVLIRGLAPGQALLMSAFRSRPVVNGGDPVKIIVQGDGFAITTEGTALAQAEAGEAVRIRLENGKILQGAAKPGRRVEIKL
jgi:flagella basal body P-ring formation protein FlgA